LADNIAVTPGTGATVAADDISGVLYQRVKVQHGGDGTATDTSAADPLPVGDAALLAAVDQLEALVAAVRDRLPAALESGRLAVETELATGAATETTLAALLTELAGKVEPADLAALDRTAAAASFGNATVDTTPALVAAANAGRVKISVQNLAATAKLYVGYDNTVSASTGQRVLPNDGYWEDTSYTGAVWAVADAACDVRWAEIG
jgi:hypothetical protein